LSLTILTSALLTRSRQRADRVGDNSLQDSDLQALLAEVYRTLYTGVAETGHRNFESTQTINATGAVSYTVPTDHLGTVRMERQLDSSGRAEPVLEISAQEQTYWRGLTGPARRFVIAKDQLYLLPTPAAGETYHFIYIPQPPDLTTFASSDPVDVVVPAGERYLVNGAAAIAKAQIDGDVSWLTSERDAAFEELIEWAQLRSFTQAPSPFVEDAGYPGPYDGGVGFWNRPR
jgi:hypothetical protein